MMLYADKMLTAVFLKILKMSVTAGCCILAVLLIRWVFHRAPGRYLYMLWTVAAFRLICPVSISTEFSLFNLDVWAERTPVQTEYAAEDPAGSPGEREILSPEGEVQRETPPKELTLRENAPEVPEERALSGAGSTPDTVSWPLRIGAYIWATGILVFLVYFAAGTAGLRRRVRKAVRICPEGRYAAGGKGRCRIYECDDLPLPFVMGIFRPRIYLPCRLLKEQRDMVLLHEQCHIRRKDHLVKYLSFGLLALYWFHPLVWAAWLCMCRDMEMSCDEKVLELLGAERRKEYSRTLLMLATDRPAAVPIPLAFGGQDIKKRILHALDFRRPAMWTGVVFAMGFLLVLALLGTDGAGEKKRELSEPDTGIKSLSERLYEARNPYVGDVSADGRLLGVIGEAFPKNLITETPFKTELQTSREPYEFHFRLMKEPPQTGLEKDLEDMDMMEAAVLMLALTDNLGSVHWSYESSEGEALPGGGFLDAKGAAEWCGAEDIKEFAASGETVQYLLDRIDSLNMRPWDSNLSFMGWYAGLPEELYAQAVPVEEESDADRRSAEPHMYLLAQTADQAVTVYGCRSYRYGDRGITIVYRSPDGEKHYSCMDEHYWGGELSGSGTEVYMADYDRDGEDEIALRRVTGLGRGAHAERLTLFEICKDGTLEESDIFTEERYGEEIRRCVDTVTDDENRQVHVVLRAPEAPGAGRTLSSEPLLTIPYHEGQSVQQVSLDSDVRFVLGDEIWLETTVGLSFENFPGIWYGHAEEEADRKLRFRVLCEDAAGTDGRYPALTDPEKVQ